MAKAKTPKGRRTPVQNAQPALAGQTVAADTAAPKKRTSIPQFLGQVRAEGRKIVWPSRKEVMQTTILVLIMTSILAVFFLGVDQVLGRAVKFFLGLGA